MGCGAPDAATLTIQGTHSIAVENEFAGSSGFEVTTPAFDAELEAYASLVSAQPGDDVDLFVNVDQPDEVYFELYRIGYYQGRGGRLMWRSGREHVEPQAECPIDATTGLIECAWRSTFRVHIEGDYVTGYYLFKVVSARGFETRVPLVVREVTPSAPLLVQSSTNTWQAYNDWGGVSLYVNRIPELALTGRSRALRVSYDRPYARDFGAGSLFEQEAWMARWLEQKGYDVAYVSNTDVDREPTLFDGRKIILSVGHDEYNSVVTRDAFDAASERGVSLAFFSANAGYWRVRHEPSSAGAAARIVTCYKDAALDPLRDSVDTTTLFRLQPFARPEGRLEGVMYQVGGGFPTDLPMVVADPTSWVLEGTGLKPFERLANVLGPEWDQYASAEAPEGTEIVLDSPTVPRLGGFTRAHATVHYPTDQNFVFAAGTIDWARALSHPDVADSRIQRMTENLLARAGLPPRQWTLPEPPQREPPQASEVTVLAGSGEPGYLDGAAESARFNAPTGIALGPDGALYVTEARNHDVRRIAPDGTVTTVAGCGDRGRYSGRFKDGMAWRACFNTPTSIVAAPDGRLFVSDSLNNRIRMIADRRVTTIAGSSHAGLVDSPDPRLTRLSAPRGMALGSDGSLYVVELEHGAIRRIDPLGGVSTLLLDARGIAGIAVAADDTIYLSNMFTGQLLKLVDGQAVPIANLSGQPGDSEGPADTARLRPGEGLLLDGSRLIVADMSNYRLRELDLETNRISSLAGDGQAGSEASHMVLPRGVTRYLDGYAVADTGNHRILYVRR
ncbi:MAG: hypothetical protein QM756_34250 [Polyangiaceae bacterium]